MCGIGGFCSFTRDYTSHPKVHSDLLVQMHKLQSHRGPDDQGTYLAPHVEDISPWFIPPTGVSA